MGLAKYEVTCVEQDEYAGYQEFIEIYGSYRFFSEGKNGKIELRVIITHMQYSSNENMFNLGFGVWDCYRKEVLDNVQTRNGDMMQILATVADIALNFLEQNPYAAIYAEGSSLGRTRLYQRELSKIIDDLPADLCIFGLIQKYEIGFIEFRKGINFDAFLLSKR